MSECLEVAQNIAQSLTGSFKDFDAALRWTRSYMNDESETVINNVAYHLHSILKLREALSESNDSNRSTAGD
jgi:ribosomal protein S17E